MTADFWKHIQPQLDEIIAGRLSEACPAECLIEILDAPYLWWQQSPFDGMKVWYEDVDLSFNAWLNAAEILVGSTYSNIFEQELKAKIRTTIEYQWDLRIRDLAEDYEAEMKEVA